MTRILDIIDRAIKRLVAPVAMFVAAALIGKGLDNPTANEIVIKSVMVLLSLFAFWYMLLSAKEAFEDFSETGIGVVKSVIFTSSFLLVYAVLAFAAVYMGIGKIT
ncbi:hypothetical protein WM009_21400 [Vibrio vulnificus]|uniref:hypothetical protein n=1 Tax=Vibrio vulnificus TaxID=672 RepID=UPI0030ED6AC9